MYRTNIFLMVQFLIMELLSNLITQAKIFRIPRLRGCMLCILSFLLQHHRSTASIYLLVIKLLLLFLLIISIILYNSPILLLYYSCLVIQPRDACVILLPIMTALFQEHFRHFPARIRIIILFGVTIYTSY